MLVRGIQLPVRKKEHRSSTAPVNNGTCKMQDALPLDTPSPFEVVMDELPAEAIPWGLNEHLNGCLAGYQTAPNYRTAVYFALEAVWGIGRDVELRANAGTLGSVQLDKQWIISPHTEIPVAMDLDSRAWHRLRKYKSEAAHLAKHLVCFQGLL